MDFSIYDVLREAEERYPRYAHALWTLHPVEQEIKSIVADRYCRLYFDPVVFKHWTIQQCAGRVLLQIEHYFRQHGERQQGRPQVTWNYATEIAVTSSFDHEGIALPEPLLPTAFGLPEQLTAEEYEAALFAISRGRYEALLKAGALDPNLPRLFGSAASEGHFDWELPEDAAPAVDAILLSMFGEVLPPQAGQYGSTPGNRDLESPDEVDPFIAWRNEIRMTMGSLLSEGAPGYADYSYLAPDTEIGMHPGIIYPGMVGMRPEVRLILDTSGSMYQARMARAMAELGSALQLFGAQDGLMIFGVDAAVQTAQTVFHTHQIKLVGGGGTDLRPAITAALRQAPHPDVLIIATDGDTPWPKRKPKGVRVMIVLVGDGSAPSWADKVFSMPA